MAVTARPGGVYRRRIELTKPSPTRVLARLEDDFHRFDLVVEHDGIALTGLRPSPIRYPWSTCPSAAKTLNPLIGAALTARPAELGARMEAVRSCTHLHDLTVLGMAHASRTETSRTYDVAIPDRIERKATVELHLNGTPFVTWDLDGSWITGPSPFAGRKLRGGFVRWAREALEGDQLEGALVLQRACEVSFGRRRDLDPVPHPEDVEELTGACFTFRQPQAAVAVRMVGTGWDFTHAPERLLRDRSVDP